MRVTIRVIGLALPAGSDLSAIDLPDDATVETALHNAASLLDNGTSPEQLCGGTLLLNNRRAYLSDPLHDGDHLHVLRTLEGG